MSQPIADATIISLILALVTAGFGVFVERHFVSKWTILSNFFGIVSLALALTWSQILEFILLIGYAALGISFILWKRKFKGKSHLKHFFGSKIYGSIALVYACNAIDNSNLARGYLNFLESQGFPNILDGYVVFFSWMVILTSILVASAVAIILLYLYRKKHKR